MNDLSHWDFENKFTGLEVAYLILGLEPDSGLSSTKLKPILSRMRQSFDDALRRYPRYIKPDTEPWCDLLRLATFQVAQDPGSLHSTELFEQMSEVVEGFTPKDEYYEWLRSQSGDVEFHHFSRNEVSRWLQYHSLQSKYRFDIEQSVPEKNGNADACAEKELDTKERRTLYTIILALCHELKYNLDTHSATAVTIENAAQLAGLKISKRSIEEYLKRAREEARFI